MNIHCLSWFAHLWVWLSNLFQAHEIRFLPEDVIIQILSKLPTEHIVKCRRVCRQWQELTSTPLFVKHHLKREKPSVLWQLRSLDCSSTTKCDLKFFITEASVEKVTKTSLIHLASLQERTTGNPTLICSYNGLVLFRSPGQLLFIINPITQETFTFKPPYESGIPIAIFFNHLVKEYQVLYVHALDNLYLYFICTVRFKVWRQIKSFCYKPVRGYPAVLNGNIYWVVDCDINNKSEIPPCSDAILEFNMDSEDFHALPHPGDECPSKESHKTMYLFETKDTLCFCHKILNQPLMELWFLEVQEKWEWVQMYKVRHAFIGRLDFRWPRCFSETVHPVNIYNDELLLAWSRVGFFFYHLKLHQVREIWKSEMFEGLDPTFYRHTCSFSSYTKSLVTLKEFSDKT